MTTSSTNDIINISNKTSFLIGASRSGKTSFIKLLLKKMEKKEVFLFIKDANEWSTNNYNHRIHIYTTVNPFETPILKEANNIPNGSVVILDDYVHLFLTKSNHLARFQNLIYVEASHKQLTVIFSIQSTVRNNLSSIIMSSSLLFFTYCGSNKMFINRFFPDLSKHYLNHFSKGVQQFDVALIDTRQQRIIPAVNNLLSTIKKNRCINMFAPDEEYIIIPQNSFVIYEKNNEQMRSESGGEQGEGGEGGGEANPWQDFLSTLSCHGRKLIKPNTEQLAKTLFQFCKRTETLSRDDEGNYFIKVPKSNIIIYLIDLVGVLQSQHKNSLFMNTDNRNSSLLPETISVIKYLRKNKFTAPRNLITNKEVYGRLMYPQTKCSLFWKYRDCDIVGNHSHDD